MHAREVDMRLIRQHEIERLTGLSRHSIRRLEEKRVFPQRRRVSPGVVAWVEEEITEWIAARQPVQTNADKKGV